jgi:hypothetical protein
MWSGQPPIANPVGPYPVRPIGPAYPAAPAFGMNPPVSPAGPAQPMADANTMNSLQNLLALRNMMQRPMGAQY